MDPKEALKIIDTVCSQISMSRDGHNKVINALAALQKVVDASSVTPETG